MYPDGYVYPNVNYGYSPIQRVPNVEVVDAYRVPLDGRVSYFVLQVNVGQCAQTAMIVNQLRPFPQPAYTVANPYATPTATT